MEGDQDRLYQPHPENENINILSELASYCIYQWVLIIDMTVGIICTYIVSMHLTYEKVTHKVKMSPVTRFFPFIYFLTKHKEIKQVLFT